ncbi:MAG: ferredoxin--NADP reductase [Flavobacteriaceae bacterium]
MSEFHPLKVVQLDRLTPNSVAITFEVPDQLKPVFEFKAGQYITIRHYFDGKEVRRAYSISSAPGHDRFTIGVKKVPSGLFSVYANTEIKVGDIMDVMPPEGRFVYDPGSNANHIIAYAAGSGITPIMSILQTALESQPESTVVLLYGNQNKEETMFYKDIEELSKLYTDRFFVQWVFSRSREEDALFGRIEASTVNFINRNKFKERVFDAHYICGPESMIKTVNTCLVEKDIKADRIFTELFTSSETAAVPLPTEDGSTEISVTLDDEEFTFRMKKGQLLLDAVLDQDIDAPYSCQGGVCSTCIAKVTEGQVTMEQNQILTDGEVEDGLILTCQAHPTTDVLKIDYDDV